MLHFGQASVFEHLEQLSYSQLFILTDENCAQHCLPILQKYLPASQKAKLFIVPPSEESKSLSTAGQLWEALSQQGADRRTLLLNLGGGMITDLGGFVASTYQRGIRFVNLPTSLLAQVDASVGGKTGINHAGLKNLVGCFAEAEMTLIYPPFLTSLPLRERRAGYAEMLKHGLIAGGKHWEEISQYQPDELPSLALLQASVAVKQQIVKTDFKELGLRKTLNLGHTLGHAFESFSLHHHADPMLHGEAVALGLYWELELAKDLSLIPMAQAQNIQHLIQTHFSWPAFEAQALDELLQYCYGDKKNEQGKLNMVLLEELGKVNYSVQVQEQDLIKVLKKILTIKNS